MLVWIRVKFNVDIGFFRSFSKLQQQQLLLEQLTAIIIGSKITLCAQ